MICGVQQVGVGVFDVVKSYNWYIKAFGCDIMVTDAEGVAERMLPYTGGKPRPRRAILAINPRGGGGFEVWQPKDNHITPPAVPAQIGDLGITICKIKATDVRKAYDHIESVGGAEFLGGISTAPYGKQHFYMKDPWGNMFEVVEDDYVFNDIESYCTGGTHGAVIGVSDMDATLAFYKALLGYDKVEFDAKGNFPDLASVPGGTGSFRRVLVTRTEAPKGAFSDMYGTSCIEFVQALDRTPAKTFDGRWWGDPGFIQLCFDVVNMEGMHEKVKALGQDFVCDGGVDFKMAEADGHFTYVEDPDGTLIELVETFRVPVYKKLGIYLDLRKRDSSKKLPRLVLKAMRLLSVKSIKE